MADEILLVALSANELGLTGKRENLPAGWAPIQPVTDRRTGAITGYRNVRVMPGEVFAWQPKQWTGAARKLREAHGRPTEMPPPKWARPKPGCEPAEKLYASWYTKDPTTGELVLKVGPNAGRAQTAVLKAEARAAALQAENEALVAELAGLKDGTSVVERADQLEQENAQLRAALVEAQKAKAATGGKGKAAAGGKGKQPAKAENASVGE